MSNLPITRARAIRLLSNILIHLLLIAGVLYALIPLLWGLSTSFKIPQEISAYPPQWIPDTLYFGNYLQGLFSERFLRYLFNSIVVVLLTTGLSLILASHAAYAVARFRFRGSNTLLFLMWATIMIPGVSTIVPLYLLAVDIGLFDTLWILILIYTAWLVPTLVWLLKGFVESVPQELEDSALIDGCTRVGAFYRVNLPLMMPGLGAGAVLVFVTIWNDFLLAYALTLSDQNRLVQVGLYFFVTEVGIDWGPLMAATIGALLPIIIAFMFLQRAFIQGITAGAVKG